MLWLETDADSDAPEDAPIDMPLDAPVNAKEAIVANPLAKPPPPPKSPRSPPGSPTVPTRRKPDTLSRLARDDTPDGNGAAHSDKAMIVMSV